MTERLYESFTDDRGRMRHRFEPIGDEPLPHEGVQIDFEGLLEKRRLLRETLAWTSEYELRSITQQLRREAIESGESPELVLKDLATRIIERIKESLGSSLEEDFFFDVYELVDLNAFFKKEGVKSLSEFDKDEGIGGSFDPESGKIFIEMKKPEYNIFMDLVDQLALGIIPNPATTYVHEKIHSLQYHPPDRSMRSNFFGHLQAYSEYIIAFASLLSIVEGRGELVLPVAALAILEMVRKDRERTDQSILREVQAYKSKRLFDPGRTEFDSDLIYRSPPIPEDRPAMQKDTRFLIRALSHRLYRHRGSDAVDRIIAASQAVDRLYSLGFKVNEVALMVRGATHYDKKMMGYPKLEKRIQEEAKRKHLRMEQLDGLTDARVIEREIRLLTIAHIAQEEIQKAFDT